MVQVMLSWEIITALGGPIHGFNDVSSGYVCIHIVFFFLFIDRKTLLDKSLDAVCCAVLYFTGCSRRVDKSRAITRAYATSSFFDVVVSDS